jgi:hypothetical protein
VKSKTHEFDCDARLATALARAISAYAHAAFPEGGSECAQVSREALLDTARLCQAHASGRLAVRRRQLAQLRSAVNWYFTEIAPAEQPTARQLTQLLKTARKHQPRQINDPPIPTG